MTSGKILNLTAEIPLRQLPVSTPKTRKWWPYKGRRVRLQGVNFLPKGYCDRTNDNCALKQAINKFSCLLFCHLHVEKFSGNVAATPKQVIALCAKTGKKNT